MIDYSDILECYILYVEYHKTLRDVGKELMLSHQQVKNRLDRLEYINDEMYHAYKHERGTRKVGRKKAITNL